MLKIVIENKIFFFTSILILLIFSSIISFPNVSLDLYFNHRYINVAESINNLFKIAPKEGINDISTFPIWGYGIIHWIFNSSKLNILIFQQVLNFFSIYLLDKVIRKNHQKSLFIWRMLVLVGFPYFLFHTQLWPKSISSSLLILAFIHLINYFTDRKKIQLIFSGLLFGLLCNFRSDYIYFILFIPIFLVFWEIIEKKKPTIFSFSTSIIPFLTLLLLIPWGLFSYLKTNHFLIASTNSGHTLFIGLGQLPDNEWGITPRDDDPKMDEILNDKFKHKNFSSTEYYEDQYLKKVFFKLIKDFPVEWLKKCSNNIKLIFLDPFYVGNVGDFQKNGISNIHEIRALEDSVYRLDFKNIYQITKNTNWGFSLKEMSQLFVTILTKAIGIIIFLLTILNGIYILFYKTKWYFKSPTYFILSLLIVYQITLSIFVFHMPVYNTSIYLIYLVIIAFMINEIFFNSTVNKNKGVSENNIPKI